jgi:hypothetical protein
MASRQPRVVELASENFLQGRSRRVTWVTSTSGLATSVGLLEQMLEMR